MSRSNARKQSRRRPDRAAGNDHQHSEPVHHRNGRSLPLACHLCVSLPSHWWWLDLLRRRSRRLVPGCGDVCRSHPSRREARRPSRAGTGQIPACSESQDRKRARLDGANCDPAARRRGDRVKRRAFITLIGGAAAWPLAAQAQQPGKLPIIGHLGGTTSLTETRWVAAFVQRLHELGWIKDRTVAIESRWTEGRAERAAEIAAEFVRMKVDVIITTGTANVVAAKQATSAIPIVFAAAGDPVGTGLVASLGRPGGNVTGLSLLATDLAGKRIELLREVVPGLRRLAITGNVSNAVVVLEMGQAQAAARSLGLDVLTSEIRKAEDVAPAFEPFKGH